MRSDGTVDTAKNTGNIARQTVSFNGMPQPFVQSYRYDSLYRLTEATETQNGTQTWTQQFGYDRYGNRVSTEQNISGIASNTTPAVDPLTNRFVTAGTTFQYDLNGNLVRDQEGRQFTFNGDYKQTEVRDANNNIVGTYFYDGEGHRVKKVTQTETVVFVYSNGKLAAEYSTAAAPANPTTNYTATDMLGSPRVLTDSLGNVVSRRDFLPFGEELYADGVHRTVAGKYSQTGQDGVRQRFTGYQKDAETSLDFAKARMYANTFGRFTAVDPVFINKKRLIDPQQFNLYSYTRNNPFSFVDRTGKDIILANAEALKRARENIDKNLRSDTERSNIVIRGNKVVLRNPSAIDLATASAGYKLLYEFIKPDAKKKVYYYGIREGQTVTTPLLGTKTYQEVAATADIGTQEGNVFELIVAIGANVEAASAAESPLPIPFPEHLAFAHSLAHFSCESIGMCAVVRENLLRSEQGLPLRSTRIGHTNLDANGNDITIPFFNDGVDAEPSYELIQTSLEVVPLPLQRRMVAPPPTPPTD